MMTPLHRDFYEQNVARLPLIWQKGLAHSRIRFVWELVGSHRRYHPVLPDQLGQTGVTNADDKTGLIQFTTGTFDDDTLLHEMTHALVALVRMWNPQADPTHDPDFFDVYSQAVVTHQSIDAFMCADSEAYSLSSPDEFIAQLVGMGLTENERPDLGDGQIHPLIHPLGEPLWPGSTPRLLVAESRFTQAIARATTELSAPTPATDPRALARTH